MFSQIYSATPVGIEGVLVRVEVDVYARGLPSFTIVGLPDKAVEESKERVRTALRNTSMTIPSTKIVVNLAPADIPKYGSHFDLPIAVGILCSSGFIDPKVVKDKVFIGELSLDGAVRPVNGVLPIVISAKAQGYNTVFAPIANIEEAQLISSVESIGVSTIQELVEILRGRIVHQVGKKSYPQWVLAARKKTTHSDFSDIVGQPLAKRALEIAAAGGHNIHLKGPPGAGKTMLASATAGILPDMTEEEGIDVLRIHSVTASYRQGDFLWERPFRAPHHTISRVGMVGGGSVISPGEISLAHRGVLFLDEFPEFPRGVLEALRQPIEDGHVTVTRAIGTFTFPARFMLICASNPCPCGYRGDPHKSCRCSANAISRYQKRLSGPILDRIDMHVSVRPVETKELMKNGSAESTGAIRLRVQRARDKQHRRFAKSRTNAEMTSAEVKETCPLSEEVQTLLQKAITQLSLSARAYYKIIKVARTICDMDGSEDITRNAILEAIQYRVDSDRL
ncbi:MAG: Competence protein ComM [Microgenomates bacterium OLB22]|nr:MAG: Competence protein ComM [Microgenomates bacterium OLB22]